MKNLKFLIVPIISSFFFLLSCEKDSSDSFKEETKVDVNQNRGDAEFDFAKVEELSLDEISSIEKSFIEETKNISLVKALQDYDGPDEVDHSIVNDYLVYKGEKPIDTREYYLVTEEIIRNPEASVEEFTAVLQETGVYSTVQLELFTELDAQMVTATTFEEAIETLTAFEGVIKENRELNTFDRNTMLLYMSTMKGLMYTDYAAQKGFWDCVNCVWRNGWKILGWGVFRSIPKVIGCIFSNLSNGWGMFWCILRALGSGVAHSFNRFCGSVC